MKSFLGFIVAESLEGRADRLKEFTIATEVFGRDDSFDPQTNTIVRVEAGRLRRRLERYYLTDGAADPIRIDLPKGAYVPLFRATPQSEAATQPVADRRPDPSDAAIALPAGPSIAVLPFANLSGDPEQEFFADGITEEIINGLTRFPELRVIARHSTFKYKGQRLDIRDVGRDLGVRYVLEGSVRRGGDLVRVTGQLIDAADGSHLFSETYDRDLSEKNILEIQDSISERLVAAVGQPYGVIARADGRLSQSKPSGHFEAYDAVLRFYEYWNDSSAELHDVVRQSLERAVELDPGYASAWAALGEIYLDELIFGFNPRDDGNQLARALDATQRAVMLEPESSMAYHILSNTHFHAGQLDEFKAAGERAIALNPNHADMLADYGLRLCCMGDWERGMALADKAIDLSPTHPGWFHAASALRHYDQGNHEAALAEAKQMGAKGLYWTHVILAMCCGQLGRDQEAGEARAALLEMVPDFGSQAWGLFALWNFSEALTRRFLEGLRKAGLAIAERAK